MLKHLSAYHQKRLCAISEIEAADPAALRVEINTRIEIEEMIDPRDTRRLACKWIADAYRIFSQPPRLRPRALAFRP